LFSTTTGLSPLLRELLADDARQQVGDAARGEGDDDAHGLLGIDALREGQRRRPQREKKKRLPQTDFLPWRLPARDEQR
jgi:hypothetical protein